MRRFLIDNRQGQESLLWLSPEESRHAVKVLRMKQGEKINVFDSEGHEFEARISQIDPKGRVQIEILTEKKQQRISQISLHVAQSFLQKSKMDWIVEKSCEIGIASLIPLESEFSMVHPKGESIGRMQARWERILLEAAKQSGNVGRLRIYEPMDLKTLFSRLKEYDFKFLFHPSASNDTPNSVLEEIKNHTKPLNVILLIGPEGGFSDREVQCAEDAGVRTVCLGQNILRAETAFVVLAGIFKLLT